MPTITRPLNRAMLEDALDDYLDRFASSWACTQHPEAYHQDIAAYLAFDSSSHEYGDPMNEDGSPSVQHRN